MNSENVEVNISASCLLCIGIWVIAIRYVGPLFLARNREPLNVQSGQLGLAAARHMGTPTIMTVSHFRSTRDHESTHGELRQY